jgi:hypothetical protein
MFIFVLPFEGLKASTYMENQPSQTHRSRKVFTGNGLSNINIGTD